MILSTERLLLRPWEETDAEELYKYAKDPLVGPAAGWPVHTSVENSREIIRTVLSAPETYAVCLRESGKPVGSIGLMIGKASNLNLKDDEAEVGYWLGVPFWGRGLMPEAVREIIRRGFADLKLKTLWCGYFDGNGKSKRCQEKCGFVYHHTNENFCRTPTGEIKTEHVTRLTPEQWKAGFTFRELSLNEIPGALALCRRVFSEYEAPVYPPEGTAEFLRSLRSPQYLTGIEYYGAFDNSRMTGVLGIRGGSGHICLFFVDGSYHRLGIGTRLFETVREKQREGAITLNSAPYGIPFYRSLGFTATAAEQTVNGIRFTPMIYRVGGTAYRLVKLTERRDLLNRAAAWFSSKWSVPEEAYLESIENSFDSTVPSWYLCLDGENIAGGMGVIENDFHDRPDLTPNVCAVYTEPEYRCRGIAGKLLNYVCEDMAAKGIDTLYLLTDHTGFYERYGWEYLCPATGEGEDRPSRMYVHHYRREEA